MNATVDVSAAVTSPAARAGERSRTATPGEAAWITALPTAALATLGIWLLGPPLGRALFPPLPYEFWPSWAGSFTPEPVEQGRFLVALAAPLLLTALTVALVRTTARGGARMRSGTIGGLVTAAQVLLVAFIAVCVVVQHRYRYGAVYTLDPSTTLRQAYFSVATLAVAAAATVGIVLAVRHDAARRRIAAWLRDTRAKRLVAVAVAALATAVWLLHAFHTDGSIGSADPDVAYHLQYPLDETYSVLNGRSPFVDFVPLYGFLWPYAFAGGMALLDDSIGVYMALALLATGAGMLAIYSVLRRVARSATAGLLLFLPFLATSFFLVRGDLVDRYTFATLPGTFPMRFAGPFMLAWLVARHLDGARPRAPWALFLVAGLVVLNNPDTGLPALGAMIAAFLWTIGRPTAAALARLALALVAGLAGATALVAALTLVRAGELPDLGALMYFPRAFGAGGFLLLPMPALGLHLVVYLTFVAAIGTATARALSGDRDRALTGLLAFSGILGLGAGAYFVGRSHPESLVATFTTWSFALALLLVVALRALAARRGRRPALAELACLFGFAAMACSLAQTPLPWQQVDRLQRPADPVFAEPAGQQFVAARTDPGERVLILVHLSHCMAVNLGITNVSPYTGAFAMPLTEQMDVAIDALREADGRKVFISSDGIAADVRQGIAAHGFALRGRDATGMEYWVEAGSG